jgi:hypothetical protein
MPPVIVITPPLILTKAPSLTGIAVLSPNLIAQRLLQPASISELESTAI